LLSQDGAEEKQVNTTLLLFTFSSKNLRSNTVLVQAYKKVMLRSAFKGGEPTYTVE
jgi:hypothetical protein